MFLTRVKPDSNNVGDIDTLRNDLNVLEFPNDWVTALQCAKILLHDYGFLRSTEENNPVDRDGKPLPLYTYPAIEYLNNLDFSECDVFEYGSGNSTVYWSGRARSVVAVENLLEWYDRIKNEIPPNARVIFADGDGFPEAINDCSVSFDVIVIDGKGYRFDCAEEAVTKLKPGGMIILDNSDWHFQTAAYLRSKDLIQIDFSGFRPIQHFTSTTSLFLHRQFALKPRQDRQPVASIGGKAVHSKGWDKRQRP